MTHFTPPYPTARSPFFKFSKRKQAYLKIDAYTAIRPSAAFRFSFGNPQISNSFAFFRAKARLAELSPELAPELSLELSPELSPESSAPPPRPRRVVSAAPKVGRTRGRSDANPPTRRLTMYETSSGEENDDNLAMAA